MADEFLKAAKARKAKVPEVGLDSQLTLPYDPDDAQKEEEPLRTWCLVLERILAWDFDFQ